MRPTAPPRRVPADSDRGEPVSPQRGFTLVELLVVIGIIALLISILLPSLAKAKANARSVQCMSNLHQVYVAFGNYLVDNRGMGTIQVVSYPTVPAGMTGVTSYSQYWFASYASGASGTTFDYTQGYLTRYFKDVRVINCPVLADLTNLAILGTGSPTVGYGYNTQTANLSILSAGMGQLGIVRFAQIRNPTETMALIDAANIGTSGAQKGLLVTAYASNQPAQKFPSFAGRHNGQGNVLWYDGHVTPQRPYVCQLSSSYSIAYAPYLTQWVANNIGYLTPATPGQNPESTLVFAHAPSGTPNPTNLNYYYSVNKSIGE